MSANGVTGSSHLQPAPEVLEVIRSTRQELAGLLQQRAEIARRMSAIRQLLPGLAELFGTSILEGVLFTANNRGSGVCRQRGLTRACRLILLESRTPMRVRQGCEELQRRFPELVQHHKDLKASVTTVFHRLVGYGEVRCFVDDQGVKVWEWIQETSETTESQRSVPDSYGQSYLAEIPARLRSLPAR
jgi:hypothetical protein